MPVGRPILLLVDDDQHVRQLAARFGAESGFEVVQCAGGREALTALERGSVAMALVDVYMPDVNGLEVLRAIRHRAPSCEVVLMSGRATIDTAIEAVKLGASDYLVKPIDFERLGGVLTAVRERHEHRTRLLEAEINVARQ